MENGNVFLKLNIVAARESSASKMVEMARGDTFEPFFFARSKEARP